MEDKNRTILFRFLAYGIDSIGLNLVGYVLEHTLPFSDTRIFVIIRSGLFVIYMVVFHVKFGQTPGKMLLNIKVFDYRTNQGITLQQAFLRPSLWIGLFIAEILCLYLLPDFAYMVLVVCSLLLGAAILISIFTDKEGRAIHDKIAGTIVRDVFVKKG
jgi:uncharacterized RDD family membrane protein YckC